MAMAAASMSEDRFILIGPDLEQFSSAVEERTMECHECARGGQQTGAIAICPLCSVGLCKRHLVDFHSERRPALNYACDHHPERAFPVAAPEAVPASNR
jgi:hypothetical protein